MARLAGLLLALGGAVVGAVGGAPLAVAAPPTCSSLPAPFPCGTGTHQVCTQHVKCYGNKPGIVPQLSRTCTQAKCVKDPVKTPASAQKKLKLNPQPEPPGVTKAK